MNIHAGFTPAACRAARAALDLTQEEVARRAGISRATLINFEAGKGVPLKASVAAIRRVFDERSRLGHVLRKLQAARAQFEARGVIRMAVFGSVARMEDGPDSDLDIVVDLDAGRRFSLLDLAGIAGLAEDLLGMSVDIVRRRPDMKPELATRIAEDQIYVF